MWRQAHAWMLLSAVHGWSTTKRWRGRGNQPTGVCLDKPSHNATSVASLVSPSSGCSVCASVVWHHAAGRAVSVTLARVIAYLLGRLVYEETRQRWAGAATGLLWLALHFVYSWAVLMRQDMLSFTFSRRQPARLALTLITCWKPARPHARSVRAMCWTNKCGSTAFTCRVGSSGRSTGYQAVS
jgi:hypothetical protein